MPKKGIIDIEFQPAIKQIAHRISSLPKAYQDEILDEVGDYGLEVLKKYPRRKYVTRMAAYGRTWFSDRQRRWFMWAVGAGKIRGWKMTKDGPKGQYIRSGKMGDNWVLSGSGEQIAFKNETPGVQFVMGDKQSKHEEMVGWKKASKVLAGALTFRSSKFRNIVQKAYQRAIRKVKLG